MRVGFVSILVALAFGVNAQEYLVGSRADTLGATDTVYFYVGGSNTASGSYKIKEIGALSTKIVSDSLSGATNGTVVIQYCMDATGTDWYTHATLTPINGAAQQVQTTDDDVFLAYKVRYRITSPGGAQATRLRFYYVFKSNN
jgi:hypothetical protein